MQWFPKQVSVIEYNQTLKPKVIHYPPQGLTPSKYSQCITITEQKRHFKNLFSGANRTSQSSLHRLRRARKNKTNFQNWINSAFQRVFGTGLERLVELENATCLFSLCRHSWSCLCAKFPPTTSENMEHSLLSLSRTTSRMVSLSVFICKIMARQSSSSSSSSKINCAISVAWSPAASVGQSRRSSFVFSSFLLSKLYYIKKCYCTRLDSTKNVPRLDVQSRHRAIGESETKARRQLINKLHTLVARSHSLADLTFVFVVVETMLTSDCGTARTACSVRPSVQFDPGRRRRRSRVFVLLLQRNT